MHMLSQKWKIRNYLVFFFRIWLESLYVWLSQKNSNLPLSSYLIECFHELQYIILTWRVFLCKKVACSSALQSGTVTCPHATEQALVRNWVHDVTHGRLFWESFGSNALTADRERAPQTVPGLQEGEQSLLDNVEDRGEEERQRQEDEQFVCELPTVVLGDEFPTQLDGPRHGLELLICFLDSPRGCRFEKGNSVSIHFK